MTSNQPAERGCECNFSVTHGRLLYVRCRAEDPLEVCLCHAALRLAGVAVLSLSLLQNARGLVQEGAVFESSRCLHLVLSNSTSDFVRLHTPSCGDPFSIPIAAELGELKSKLDIAVEERAAFGRSQIESSGAKNERSGAPQTHAGFLSYFFLVSS